MTQTIELIEGCEYSSNMSANLINDLLDFAKMQQLSFTITKGWFNIVKTVENAFHVLRFEQKRKNIDLKLTISDTDKETLAHVYSKNSRFYLILYPVSNRTDHTRFVKSPSPSVQASVEPQEG